MGSEIGPEWAATDAQLAAAEHEAKVNLFLAGAPPLAMCLIGWLAVRKQRRAHRAAWQETVDQADAQPAATLAQAWERLEAFLPAWARLVEIDGTCVVTDAETDLLVTTVINPLDALERSDEQLQDWAARLRPPDRDN